MQRSQDVEEKTQAVDTLTSNEVSAATAILHYYDKHMWNTTVPSAKRSQLSFEVTVLQVKLSLVLAGRDVSLTTSDLGYLQAAFRLFISEVKQKISPSESCDGLLVSCEQLQEVFANLIPTQSTRTKQGEL
jgi:hypothetical protein